MFLVRCSDIYRIYTRDLEVTPSGLPATLRCQLETSDNFRLQYVAWSKIARDDDARREFVYHYDRCTSDDRAYGSLIGRAILTVTSQRSANLVSKVPRLFSALYTL